MINVFATAKSGMSAYQQKLDHLSNDLVNSTTTGYKSVDVGFKDLLTDTLDRKGTPLENKGAINGTGVRIGTEYRNNKQGNILPTGKNTDLAIEGKGYFAVTRADGSVAYTRDGNFSVDSSGMLVDSSGNRVLIEYENGASAGFPELSSENISIDPTGGITVNINNQIVQIGTIPLFTAVGDRSFLAIGSNCFVPTEDAQVTRCDGKDFKIVQGALEGSNVDTGQTLTEVILAQRAFELSSKAINVADELWGMINNMK